MWKVWQSRQRTCRPDHRRRKRQNDVRRPARRPFLPQMLQPRLPRKCWPRASRRKALTGRPAHRVHTFDAWHLARRCVPSATYTSHLSEQQLGHALIVEDDEDAAKMIGALVKREGHTVMYAHSIGSARRFIAMQPPDLLLLD